jgi:hypothetical protein
MPDYYDVYVLAPERSASIALQFLDEFAPHRVETAVDYQFPQHSDQPEVVLTTAHDAITYCAHHPRESQSLYFRNLSGGHAHAMLFFTEDGGLILGLSVEQADPADTLLRLREHAHSPIGYLTFEEPPPVTASEFRRLAQARSRA